ncbi:MAG: hypothetical protein LCI00_27970 [Chloroflexi bacterium]|nr:hypothetical protein [Chloroflexota bacterium]MCC6893916.1 hypothetical protein [Anaerolineae bacterium]
MKIPSDALISREKLTQYLLVFRQDSDKSIFLGQGGFTQANPDTLEAAIRELISEYEAILDNQNQYGDFYRVEGTLHGVNNHNLLVVTIWMIRSEEDGIFRFVTLKPWRAKNNAS